MAKFVSAYESADLDAVVALLTDDVFISMPPMPLEYEGRDVVARIRASIFRSGRSSTSCGREPTVSRRSEPTCEPPPASATGSGSSSSPSPATESALSPASTTACSHGSGLAPYVQDRVQLLDQPCFEGKRFRSRPTGEEFHVAASQCPRDLLLDVRRCTSTVIAHRSIRRVGRSTGSAPTHAFVTVRPTRLALWWLRCAVVEER